MSAVDNLEENSKEVFETAVRLLTTVADNILKNPNDIKFRRLKLANKNVSEKLLPAIGAIECLFEMGFDEVCTMSMYIAQLKNKPVHLSFLGRR